MIYYQCKRLHCPFVQSVAHHNIMIFPNKKDNERLQRLILHRLNGSTCMGATMRKQSEINLKTLIISYTN
jgi:hypothetical protein